MIIGAYDGYDYDYGPCVDTGLWTLVCGDSSLPLDEREKCCQRP